MFSAATQGMVEAPLAYFEPAQPRGYHQWKDEDFEGVPIHGHCVFTEARPDVILLEHFIRRGAVGFITDGYGPKTSHHQQQPDAVRWINDAFGEGMISARRRALPAFSVSPRQGRLLKERLAAGERLRARFRVQARTFDGEFHFVRAALAGQDKADERVFLLAHLFEPNISNDCSGVVILAEALAALKSLIRRGDIRPPSRTIEMFSSWEMFGIAAYATKNPSVKEHGVVGLGIDCLVRPDGPFGREQVTMDSASDPSPTFFNGVLNVFLDHFAQQSGMGWSEQNAFTGNENMLTDPTLGPPTALLSGSYQFLDGTYHTSADTADKLDTGRMAHVAALAATAAYAVAAAGPDEAAWFAQQAFLRSRRRIAQLADDALRGALDCPNERIAFLAEIERRAIASVNRLSAVQKTVDALHRSLDACARQEKERVASVGRARSPSPRDERLWEQAAAMVPARVLPGPIALQDASDEVRRQFQEQVGKPIDSLEWYGGTPDLFWADGQKSLADISKLTQLTRPALHNDQALAALVRLYTFLERHGYLRILRKPLT